jgi:Putative  PD-(D/E)XK family member, (DUF4420)
VNSGQTLRETWSILEDLRGAGDTFPVREIADVDGPEGRPLCAIDDQWRRHLLIPVADAGAIAEDRRSAGVQVGPHMLVDRDQTRPFVDLICLKSHLNELFLILVREVLDAYGVDALDPSRTCIRVLERWRELIEHEIAPQPGIDHLIGLYAELWHLRELARRTAAAGTVWTGPLGTRHDFVAPGLALEVKASKSRHGRFVEIHGPDQLEPPAGGELYLATMKVDPIPGSAGERLIDVVDDLIEMAVDRRLVLQRLLRLGMRIEDLEREGVERYSVRESRVYAVSRDFPRITPATFVGGSVPAGVINLSYQLDLSSEPPFPLDQAGVDRVYDRLVG